MRSRKLIVAPTLLLWAALSGALLGSYAWPLDLLNHFRIHYCVAFAVVGVAALWSRAPALAAAALTGCLISAWPVAPYLAFPTSSAHVKAPTLRLVTLNVWFRNTDHARIAEHLAQEDADIVVLQEALGATADRLRTLSPAYPHVFLEQSVHGAVVFSKWPILSARRRPLGAHAAAAADVVVNWRGAAVRVLGVHLHWPLGGRNSQLRNAELRALADIAASAREPLLIAGDFNTTAWSPHFRELLARTQLRDCAAGQGLAPSWPSQVRWLGIRIDHCLASPHWRTLEARTGPHVGSDHRALIADLALVAQVRRIM